MPAVASSGPALPFEDSAFDGVFLQYAAMNIDDRRALYAEMRRILTPSGRFALYDPVLREGNVVYPVPWARHSSTSFLLSELDTRTGLEGAGFKAVLWRGGTQTALDRFEESMAGSAPSGLNPGVNYSYFPISDDPDPHFRLSHPLLHQIGIGSARHT
jgi:SAM-dependent methyltransferase